MCMHEIMVILKESPTRIQMYLEESVSYDPLQNKLLLIPLHTIFYLSLFSHAMLQAAHTLASSQSSYLN